MLFPRPNDPHTCHLKEVITKSNISVGDFTYYHDFDDPRCFENKNVIYHYPINNDKLIIGKFCSIASGAKFLFNGGNHKGDSFVNYPFAIFGDLWEHDRPVNSGWDHKGDIVIGHDVWIGHEALIMAGVTVGNGARIATRALVTKDVKPYAVVGGVPAKGIKMRCDEETVRILEKLRWWDLGVGEIKSAMDILTGFDKEALRSLLAHHRG